MSATKRFYEDLSAMVSTAIYEECYDMPDYQEHTLTELDRFIFEEITNGNYETLINYMNDCMDSIGEENTPKTAYAVKQLEALFDEYRRTV